MSNLLHNKNTVIERLFCYFSMYFTGIPVPSVDFHAGTEIRQLRPFSGSNFVAMSRSDTVPPGLKRSIYLTALVININSVMSSL